MNQRDDDSQLFHPEQLRRRQLKAYYEVLSEAPGCEEELERLYVLCTEPLPMELGARRIVEFCKKRRLPAGIGAQDILWSLLFTEVVREDMPGYPFRLETRPRSIPKPSVLDLARALSDPRPGETWPEIFKRAGNELRVELKRHTPRRVPPRHHDHGDLLRMARRLYRRAVLELGWEQIAEAEREEHRGDHPDVRTIQTTVQDWANALNVPLPHRPPGRPKKR